MAHIYDVAIIGSGPAGYEAALYARELGMTVVLVEGRELGGTCLNRGCIPTKTFLHAGEIFRESSRTEAIGLSFSGRSFDYDAIVKRKNDVIESLRGGLEKILGTGGIDIVRGHAQVQGPGVISVASDDGGSTSLMAKNILVATGSSPSLPPVAGIDLSRVYTSDGILGDAPFLHKPCIIGGGVIGMEFASFYNDLGCAVTVLEAAPRILPLMDREIAQNLSMILKRRGVAIQTGAKVLSLTEKNDGTGTLLCNLDGEGAVPVECDGVLVATGRKPFTERLFAADLSIAFDHGFIAVNENFMTGLDGVYAVGDVVRGIQLAHAATAQGRAAIEHMAGLSPSYRSDLIPSCVYTSPEIATVGLDSGTAAAKAIPVVTGKALSSANARAVINGEDRGFVKLVFEDVGQGKPGAVLGGQIMCARASDLVAEVASAIASRRTARDMASVVRAHPTYSEIITAAAGAVLAPAVPRQP